MDLFKELQVGDAFLVVLDDVVVFDNSQLVAILKESICVVPEGLLRAHGDPTKVVGVAGLAIGGLVVRGEQP